MGAGVGIGVAVTTIIDGVGVGATVGIGVTVGILANTSNTFASTVASIFGVGVAVVVATFIIGVTVGVAVTTIIIRIGVGVCLGITGSGSEHAIIREKQRPINKIVFLTLIQITKDSFR